MIRPNLFESMLFYQLNLAPAPVLDIFSAVSFRIALAAVRLGVFTSLEESPASALELSERTGASATGTALLLSTLEAYGYVRQEGDRYINTPMTTRWMLPDKAGSIAAGFEYWGFLLSQMWSELEGTICRGEPALNLYDWVEGQPEASRAFQDWMVGTARLIWGEVNSKLKLPTGARRLLDVGGGHGMYSILFCQRYPGLTATVFDAPQALQSALSNIQAEEMRDRVSVQAGNFLSDELGEGYDVALLFNIFHGFTPAQNLDLLRRAASALNPGGLVVVAEQVVTRASSPAAKAVVRTLEMSYFHLLGGKVYGAEEISGWMSEAGFNSIRRKSLLKAPGNSIFTGTRW